MSLDSAESPCDSAFAISGLSLWIASVASLPRKDERVNCFGGKLPRKDGKGEWNRHNTVIAKHFEKMLWQSILSQDSAESLESFKDSAESHCDSIFFISGFSLWIASVASLPRKDERE